MAENLVTSTEIIDMVTHWVSTKPNTFFGSDYGGFAMIKELLQKPMLSASANAIINKMKKDVPILSVMPKNMINIYMEDKEGSFDRKIIYIEVGDTIVPVNSDGVVR